MTVMIPCMARLCYTDIKRFELEHLFIALMLPCFFCFDVPFAGRLLGALLPFIIYHFLGLGDILLFSALGFIMGTEALLTIFSAASLASGIVCAVSLALKKVKKGDSLPFAPYVAFGYLIYVAEYIRFS